MLISNARGVKHFSHLKCLTDVDVGPQLWLLPLPQTEQVMCSLGKELGVVEQERDSIGKRKWGEYYCGRLCAIKASRELGSDISWLARLSSGAPSWPPELKGSVSHSKSWALAAVGLSDHHDSIGCDIEEVVTKKRVEVIRKMILVEEEHHLIANKSVQELSLLATIIFSAKESLYKLVNPLCHTYLNFSEGIVKEIDLDMSTFVIELRSEKEEVKNYCGTFEGSFYLFNCNVITLLTYQKPQ
jgi:enterobactin synthetase component D